MAIVAQPYPDRALDALLAGYAAGRLSVPMSTLVASHLILSPASRAFVAHLEAAYGATVEASQPVPLPDRERMLAEIFAERDGGIRAIRGTAAHAALPPPLRRYLGCPLEEAPWRAVLPGLRECAVEESEAGEAKLIWIEPGRSMPEHSHAGLEAILVLRGGFRDGGRYRRGDIAVIDRRIAHGALADPDEDCICFAVTDLSPGWTGAAGDPGPSLPT